MKRPPEVATVTQFEDASRAARVLPRVLRHTIKPVINNIPLNRIGFTALKAVDLSGLAMRTPGGTRRERVLFNGFDAEVVTGPSAVPAAGLMVHLHGGGFVAGGLRSHRGLAARLSEASAVPVLNVAYRRLPRATLSTTIADCLAAYRWALEKAADPGSIVLSGDSAGGYLAFAVAQHAAGEGLPPPAAIVALSPWLDLECRESAAHPDPAGDPFVSARQLGRVGSWLLREGEVHPPPWDGDLSGLPPVLIQVGSREVLRCDAERLSSQLTAHGVQHELQIWQNQVHVFQIFAGILPEGLAAITEIGAFVRTYLASKPDATASALQP